jgi:hypothetical protein
VYSRQIDGRNITLVPSGWTYDSTFVLYDKLVPSGWTYDSTFVLYDKETGSLWYPNAEGLMSIQGVYFKRQLSKLAFEDTQWKHWIKKHPHSRIMK